MRGWGWGAAGGSFLAMACLPLEAKQPLRQHIGAPPDSSHPAPAPGKAVAGGKKEVKALTVWVAWRELEGKSTQRVSISPSLPAPVS